MRKRREGQPERVLTIADNAERRLNLRYTRLKARGKHVNKVVIAVARELVGFLWDALRPDRETARHGARTSAQLQGAKATTAPRSKPKLQKVARPKLSPPHKPNKQTAA